MRFCCENIVHQQKLYDDIRRDTQRLRSRFSFRRIIINVARRQFQRRRNGNFVYVSFERMRCRFGLTEINWMAHTTTHMPSCGTCLSALSSTLYMVVQFAHTTRLNFHHYFNFPGPKKRARVCE